jgi:hypothetical protein
MPKASDRERAMKYFTIGAFSVLVLAGAAFGGILATNAAQEKQHAARMTLQSVNPQQAGVPSDKIAQASASVVLAR